MSPFSGETPRHLLDYLNRRLEDFRCEPTWAASDEIDFALDLLRPYASHTLFINPLVWDTQSAAFRSISGVQVPLTGFTDIVVPLRVGRHWVQCDVFAHGQTLFVLFTNTLPEFVDPQHIADAFARLFAVHTSNVTFVSGDVPTPEGMCGWALLGRLFDRYRVPIPSVSRQMTEALFQSQFSQVMHLILDRANEAWADSTDDSSLRRLAFSVRANFLHRILSKPGPAEYLSAGAQDADANMSPAPPTTPVDPLTVHDPWAQAVRQSSKWEDLKLQAGHPFVDSSNKSLPQIHRLQASRNRGGVILASKGTIADILKVQPPGPSIIVMPATDVAVYGPLAAKVHGPYEVVLDDPKQKSSYKRLVQFLLIEGDVKFALPKPTCSFTTPLVSELVFELDSRCTEKQLLAYLQQQPLNHFREKAIESFGAAAVDAAQYYGFRISRNPPGGEGAYQLQCIVKVHTKLREQLISASGTASQIFVRDFLDRSAQPSDTTVLPRFWPVSASGLHQIIATAQGLPGFAGLQVTKRGIAVRAWIHKLADARRVFMTEDERICEANLGTVPKVLWNSAGWPPGVRPIDLVDCVKKATKQAPVPTRAFRDAGVHCWTLGFETPPSPEKFAVQINGTIQEILLSPATTAGAKGKSKGTQVKPKSKDKSEPKPASSEIVKVVSTTSSSESARIDALERKFDVFEKKQDHLEHKIDQRYNEIADSLRQLLNSSSSRSREVTGETPPGKHPKTC